MMKTKLIHWFGIVFIATQLLLDSSSSQNTVDEICARKLEAVEQERRYEQLSWKFERRNLEMTHAKNIRELEHQLSLLIQEMKHNEMMERNRGVYDHMFNALQVAVNNIKGAFLEKTRLLN